MPFGLFGEYISDSEDENYPTWPCLNKKDDGEDEVLRLLVSKLPRMGRFICQYIKRDGSICGKGCMSELGCSRHFNARPRTICPVCKMGTYSDTGICSTHGGIYDHAWRESKKTKTESDMVKT
ncbi:hypothetical protein RhiirA1_470085 [Rhizophagus irregularis]|uniref:Uncharacterized protein n=1 Tax=Rhizophagus irregularis TaxID=588596 RepID=A0A2N0R6T4_9GLOM|nr:hypothetical protein RhiirA1_470085 [Rhizophagus irregularis]